MGEDGIRGGGAHALAAGAGGEMRLVVDVEGYEGPLDLLLSMARTQKVDLRQISVLALAEQYLAFVEEAKRLRLELAADYLVMAAWLAYLKSRLLLPPDPEEEGPSGEELAAHLAFQLERLQAMREAAARLMARDRLGRDIFPRGMPESVAERRNVAWKVGLMDLLQAYARIRTRDEFRPYAFDRRDVYTMEEALEHLRGVIGTTLDWMHLETFLPEGWRTEPRRRRAALASTFAAALEMAKSGMVEIDQEATFAPIRIRRRQQGREG